MGRCESIILQKNVQESQRHGEMNQDLGSMVGQSTLSRFGFFNQGFLAADNDDAGIADMEAAAVGVEVVADLGALGEAGVAIDDSAAAAGGGGDIHVSVNDG